jgi:hypothetical protein
MQRLREARTQHKERALHMLGRFKKMITDFVRDSDESHHASTRNHVMKVFNELVKQSLAVLDWSRYSFCSTAVDLLAFLDETLQNLYKKTQGFK